MLALRKEKEEREGELAKAQSTIVALEIEISRLQTEMMGASDAFAAKADDSQDPRQKAFWQDSLDQKEEALEAARANERVNAASKEALTLQVCKVSFQSLLLEKMARVQQVLRFDDDNYNTHNPNHQKMPGQNFCSIKTHIYQACKSPCDNSAYQPV